MDQDSRACPDNNADYQTSSEVPGEQQVSDVQAVASVNGRQKRHRMPKELVRVAVLGIIGGIMVVSWPLMKFVLWPLVALVLSTLVFIMSLPLAALAVDMEDSFADVFWKITTNMPAELNTVLIVVSVIGLICLGIAGVFYMRYRKNSPSGRKLD